MPEESEIRGLGVEKTGNWIRNDVEFSLRGGEGLVQRPVGILYYTSTLWVFFHICELE